MSMASRQSSEPCIDRSVSTLWYCRNVDSGLKDMSLVDTLKNGNMSVGGIDVQM